MSILAHARVLTLAVFSLAPLSLPCSADASKDLEELIYEMNKDIALSLKEAEKAEQGNFGPSKGVPVTLRDGTTISLDEKLFVDRSKVAEVDSPFDTKTLPGGVSISLPKHWVVRSDESRKNLAAADYAMREANGLGKGGDLVLSARATPEPAGAVVRVTLTSPPEYTQETLAELTPSDFKLAGELLTKELTKVNFGTLKLVGDARVAVEMINGQKVLLLSYTRTGMSSTDLWNVLQYKVPSAQRTVELTFSYRQQEIIWVPILEKIKNSLRH